MSIRRLGGSDENHQMFLCAIKPAAKKHKNQALCAIKNIPKICLTLPSRPSFSIMVPGKSAVASLDLFDKKRKSDTLMIVCYNSIMRIPA